MALNSSLPFSCTDYVAATLEIMTQLAEQNLRFDYLICATGSSGTQTGLVIGAKWLQPGYQVWRITVSRARSECLVRHKVLFLHTGGTPSLFVYVPDLTVVTVKEEKRK